MPEGTTEEIFIIDQANRIKARGVVFDIRTALPRVALEHMRAIGLHCATIDDAAERRFGADLAIYPPVPQAAELDWAGFRGEVLIGAQWVVLSPAASRAAQQNPERVAKAPRILVSMGGSDPNHLAGPIARACTRALGEEMPIDLVVGPAYQSAGDLRAAMAKLPGVVIHSDPKDPASLYAQATLAVISFGVTAYELAALGVPALYVALTEDHRASAMGAQELGFGRFAAMAEAQFVHSIARQAAKLLGNRTDLLNMAAAGRAAIDGKGALRIAQKLFALIGSGSEAHFDPVRMSPPSLRPAVGE
jgi:spore coat polysaccharide biosynthesis predicted glycosyltransferase SpsG